MVARAYTDEKFKRSSEGGPKAYCWIVSSAGQILRAKATLLIAMHSIPPMQFQVG
jgi:hypothetical protein